MRKHNRSIKLAVIFLAMSLVGQWLEGLQVLL